jgi:hypothetical protein
MAPRRPVRAVACAFVALGAVGCSSFTDVEDFEALDLASYSQAPDTPLVEPGPGTITITAMVRTPDPCHDVSARMRREGRTLTVRVVGRRWAGGNACVAVIGTHRYRLSISGLAAGDYELVLVHAGAPAWQETVYEYPVSVDPSR